MKLKQNASGIKKLAKFPQVKNAEEEEKSAQEFLHQGHGSWLDESKIIYNVDAAKCFKVNKKDIAK